MPSLNSPASGSQTTSLILATNTGATTTQLSYSQGAANNVLITDVNGNIEWLTAGTNGQVLTYNSGGITWTTVSGGSGITSLSTATTVATGSGILLNGSTTTTTSATTLSLNGWGINPTSPYDFLHNY